MPMAVRYAARSHVGLVRDSNQDSGYAGPHLLVVADGMGGHAGGDVASSMAIGAMVHLDDDFASGRHCRVYRDEQGGKVEDLRSTNGTYLGEERLTEITPVGVGSQLRIGRTVLELRK